MSQGTIIVDGVRWQMSQAGQAILSTSDLRLADHLKHGRAETVKHGEHRTVYRVQLSGVTVYWKHCRLNGSRAWWRDLLRGPKAMLEFDRLEELTRREIATVEPLAFGRFDGRWPKGSYLITKELEGGEPLDHYLVNHPPQTAASRRAITVELARHISALHAAGVSHPDFHPGNLLVREEQGKLRFYLIDVHDIHLGPPLDAKVRRANLVLWNRWFRMRTNRSDRLRFYRTYAGSDSTLEEAGELERLTDQSVFDLWESRDLRCLRENRQFRFLKGDRVDGFAIRELSNDLVATVLRDPDAIFQRPGAVRIKDSRSSRVAAFDWTAPNERRAAIFKCFRRTRWYDALVNVFRRSPALRSWINGHAFVARGLPTPRPWLLLQRRHFGLPTESYVLFDRIDNAQHLHDAVAAANFGQRVAVIERLARAIRLMHECGASHRDLKAANILIQLNGECQILDLNGARLSRTVSRRLRVRDIMRLNASFVSSGHVSRTMRLRFLRSYLEWAMRGKEGWKRWWKEIDEATRDKIHRNAKRNRPLA